MSRTSPVLSSDRNSSGRAGPVAPPDCSRFSVRLIAAPPGECAKTPRGVLVVVVPRPVAHHHATSRVQGAQPARVERRITCSFQRRRARPCVVSETDCQPARLAKLDLRCHDPLDAALAAGRRRISVGSKDAFVADATALPACAIPCLGHQPDVGELAQVVAVAPVLVCSSPPRGRRGRATSRHGAEQPYPQRIAGAQLTASGDLPRLRPGRRSSINTHTSQLPMHTSMQVGAEMRRHSQGQARVR